MKKAVYYFGTPSTSEKLAAQLNAYAENSDNLSFRDQNLVYYTDSELNRWFSCPRHSMYSQGITVRRECWKGEIRHKFTVGTKVRYPAHKDVYIIKSQEVYECRAYYNIVPISLIDKLDTLEGSLEAEILLEEVPTIQTYEDVLDIQGYALTMRDEAPYEFLQYFNVGCYKNKSLFRTEALAKRAVAMAKISQLLPFYDAVTFEDWEENRTAEKYCIVNYDNKVKKTTTYGTWHLLAFKYAWQRDSFYDNNKELVHDYLMIPFYGEE